MPGEGSAVTLSPPHLCRKPLPRAALHSFRAVRAMLSKQDGSQVSLNHCEKASSCLRESLELGSPPKGTIDKVSRGGGQNGHPPWGWGGGWKGGESTQPSREVPPALAGVHCSCIACVRLGVQCPCHAARRGPRAATPARRDLLAPPQPPCHPSVRPSVPPSPAHPGPLAPPSHPLGPFAGGPAPALRPSPRHPHQPVAAADERQPAAQLPLPSVRPRASRFPAGSQQPPAPGPDPSSRHASGETLASRLGGSPRCVSPPLRVRLC